MNPTGFLHGFSLPAPPGQCDCCGTTNGNPEQTLDQRMKKYLTLIGAVSMALSTQAATLLNETFNYPDGDLKLAPGSTWVSHGGGSTPLNVVGGQAFIDQNDATSGRDDYNAPLSAAFNPLTDNTSVLYTSFTVNFAALPFLSGTAVNGSYFAHLKSSAASEFYARIGASTAGAAGGMFRLSIANESGTPVFLAQDLSLNTTYTVVTRLDLSTDLATLWVNPNLETDASVTDTAGAISYAAGTISAYALRQGTTGSSGNIGAPGDIYIDNLVVATSFAEVVPEPSAAALGLLAAAGVIARRTFRRA